jgi:hypothetical protein
MCRLAALALALALRFIVLFLFLYIIIKVYKNKYLAATLIIVNQFLYILLCVCSISSIRIITIKYLLVVINTI